MLAISSPVAAKAEAAEEFALGSVAEQRQRSEASSLGNCRWMSLGGSAHRSAEALALQDVGNKPESVTPVTAGNVA